MALNIKRRYRLSIQAATACMAWHARVALIEIRSSGGFEMINSHFVKIDKIIFQK